MVGRARVIRDVNRRALLALMAGGAATPAIGRPARFPPPDRELRVQVPGGRVYVRVNGDLAGPRAPIVLLHGGPGGTHAGLLDATELASERAVILYDQLDSGLSDHPGDPANWNVARFVDELEPIRRALGVERWHVLGHSWGGTVALEYAARRPAALAGVALASPLISTRSWLADTNALRRKLPLDVQAQLTACEGPAPLSPAQCDAAASVFNSAFNRRAPASEARMAYRPAGDRGFNAKLYQTMWGSSEFVSTGSLRSYDGEPLLARLPAARTLFVVGQHDEARPVTAEMFAQRLPGAEFAVVPGAAHGIFSDRPDETIGIVRAWLARQDQIS